MAAALMAVSYFADGGGSSYHVHKQDSGQIRPEHFLVRHGSRVLAHRKGRTSGMLRPDSAGIRPEQESCPGFCHPKNGNENRNVQPRLASTVMIVMIAITASRCRQSPVRLGDCALISQSVKHEDTIFYAKILSMSSTLSKIKWTLANFVDVRDVPAPNGHERVECLWLVVHSIKKSTCTHTVGAQQSCGGSASHRSEFCHVVIFLLTPVTNHPYYFNSLVNCNIFLCPRPAGRHHDNRVSACRRGRTVMGCVDGGFG